VLLAAWGRGYVGGLLCGYCFSHAFELAVDFLDLLPHFSVDDRGVLSASSLTFLQLGADEVEIFVDVLADDDEPVAVVGFCLCVGEGVP
jgi:hypothetical protein